MPRACELWWSTEQLAGGDVSSDEALLGPRVHQFGAGAKGTWQL